MTGEKIFTKKDMEIILSKDEGLARYFAKIKAIIEEYMDMDEEFYTLVSLWIVGTYFHKQFPSYPYLFFNAMKGSGKTRILKIVASLSKNGKVVGSMTDAVLFRTAKQRTLCIDELEGINAKEKGSLRLLLNSAYKKGLGVERLTKRKTKDGEEQIIEEFEVYCPIAMANIRGMENVLADRCISIVLEKSSNNRIVKLMEDFGDNMEFKTTGGGLQRLTENIKDNSNIFGHVIQAWNSYSKNNKQNIVNSVNIVNKTDNTDNIDDFTILFQKIDNTNLSGRDLELFFPLFVLADMIGEDILDKTMKTAQKVVKLRKESDREENKDIRLIEFIAQSNYEGYIDLSRIAREFSEFYEEDVRYNTSNSISRALKRLKLIIDRRNTGSKRQARIDVLKAQKKLLMFKEPDEIDFLKSGIKETLKNE